MRHSILLTFFSLALLLSGCRESELKRMPDTLPDIRGQITSLSSTAQDNEQATVTILVKAMEGIEVKASEASIQVTKETLIEDGTGKVLSAAALRQGQEVEVWFGEQIRESMPVQTDALAIRVTNTGAE